MGGGCSTSAEQPYVADATEAAAEIVEKNLEAIDQNHDGELDEDELRAALKGEDGAAARKALLIKVWSEVDADGSGTLDSGEVKGVLLRMGRKEEDIDLPAVLAAVDADGSGDVDYKEFEAWYLEQDLKSQVDAAKHVNSATGNFEPFHVGRSGPTLIGRSAHNALNKRSHSFRAKAAEGDGDSSAGGGAEGGARRSFLGRRLCRPRKLPEVVSPNTRRMREAQLEAEHIDEIRWWFAGDGLWVTTRHHHLEDVGAIYYCIETLADAKTVTIRWVDDDYADFSMKSRINYIESGFPFPEEGTKMEGKGRWKEGPELVAKVFKGKFTATVSEDDSQLSWSDGDVWKRVATRNKSLVENKRAAWREKRKAERAAAGDYSDYSDDEYYYSGSDSESSDSDQDTPEYDWLGAKRPLRQSALPALTLPCSPLPAGRGGITKDDGVWTRFNAAMQGRRFKSLTELREAFNSYCPGLLGYNTVGQLSVAGLSEMMVHFPETRKGGEYDFLNLTLPHIVDKALSLTELCRASLEHSAGWYHRTDLHGNGVWFHPATKQFSRGPPEAVRRIKSMMPSEWVDNCAKDVLKMLRQGATERVGIPREMVTCLLANMFLCSFPATEPAKHLLPVRTLGGLLGSRLGHDVARLRAFLHYFERDVERERNGKLPPALDLQKMFADMIEFKMATPEEVYNMKQFIIMEKVTPEEYIIQYMPTVEKFRAVRSRRYAEETGFLERDVGAALSELSMGEVRVSRQHCTRTMDAWSRSEARLLPIQTVPAGGEQDEALLGRTSLQVLSSSVTLGGSVLTAKQDPDHHKRRQYLPTGEEVLFTERPELLMACLLCPALQDTEAVTIVGAEQFCEMSGTGAELRYGKTTLDQSPRADDGTVLTGFTCIDPIDACGSTTPWPLSSQILDHNLLREINKAYAGFRPANDKDRRAFRTIATGSNSWGCGSHLAGWGHIELRAVLQWLAASESERPLRYFEKEARAINMGTRLRDFMIKLTRPRQAINFEKAFRAFDEDGDGDITTIEFTDGLKKLGIHLSPQQTMDILRAFDRDGDGSIDYREFAKQFNSSGVKSGANHLSRKLTGELRDRFEALMEEDEEAAAASARAREAALLGGEVYVCVKNCRVRATEEIDSEEVGSLTRGNEVVALERVEVDAIKAQQGVAVAEEHKGQKLMRLRIEEPIAGWVSLTLPGGEPQLEPMQQVRNICVGELWDALVMLCRWMNKPHNAAHPQNPLTGAPFLETLAEVVESPEGFMDATKDMRLRVIGCKGLKRADGFVGKSDPYAVVYWNEEKLGTTKTVENDLNPTWNEDFPISVNLEHENTLRVAVFDKDKVGEDEFLGQVSLYGEADSALPIYEADYQLGARTMENGVEMGLAKKLMTFDLHVGGTLTMSVGHADEEVKKWGIDKFGKMVPIRVQSPLGEPDRCVYKICVFTARAEGAGTDAKVFITLTGRKVGMRTKSIALNREKLVKFIPNLFEAGGIDLFEAEDVDVGELLKIKIGHDNSRPGAAWLLDKVVIENTTTGVQWTCKCSGEGQWFDHNRGDGKVVRELLPSERVEKKPKTQDAEGAEHDEDGAEGDAKQVTFEEGSKASAYSYSAYSSDEEETTGLRRFMPSFGSKKKKHRDEDADGTGEKEMSEKEMKREEKRLEKEEKLREKEEKKREKEEEKAASAAAKAKAEAKAAEEAAAKEAAEQEAAEKAAADAAAAAEKAAEAEEKAAAKKAKKKDKKAKKKDKKGKKQASPAKGSAAVEGKGQVEDVDEEEEDKARTHRGPGLVAAA